MTVHAGKPRDIDFNPSDATPAHLANNILLFSVILKEEMLLNYQSSSHQLLIKQAKSRSSLNSLARLLGMLSVRLPKENLVETITTLMSCTAMLECMAEALDQQISQEPAAQRLLQHLLDGDLPNPFRARDVYKEKWPLLQNSDAVQAACALLIARGWLQIEKTTSTKRGRPSTAYRLLARGGSNG